MSGIIQSRENSAGTKGNDRSPCALADADSQPQLCGTTTHLLKLVSVLVSEASASALLERLQ